MVMVYGTTECALAVINKYTGQIIGLFDCKRKDRAKKLASKSKSLHVKKVNLRKLM
ncbi:MAG: hypothetical protein PVI03_01385 [Candidatus Thorarchaeota archaeon]